MRKLFLLMLVALPLVAGAQTVELSALNYGTVNGLTWQQRDAKFLADVQAMLDNHAKSADLTLLYHYAYTINDSAFSVLDAPGDSVTVIERYVNYRAGNIVECPVELQWATISKHSPAKVSIAKYNGWKGGPWDKKVPALKADDSAALAVAVVTLAKVEAAMKDGKEWTEKQSGKKMTEAEKRKAAWKIETGKMSASAVAKATKEKTKLK